MVWARGKVVDLSDGIRVLLVGENSWLERRMRRFDAPSSATTSREDRHGRDEESNSSHEAGADVEIRARAFISQRAICLLGVLVVMVPLGLLAPTLFALSMTRAMPPPTSLSSPPLRSLKGTPLTPLLRADTTRFFTPHPPPPQTTAATVFTPHPPATRLSAEEAAPNRFAPHPPEIATMAATQALDASRRQFLPRAPLAPPLAASIDAAGSGGARRFIPQPSEAQSPPTAAAGAGAPVQFEPRPPPALGKRERELLLPPVVPAATAPEVPPPLAEAGAVSRAEVEAATVAETVATEAEAEAEVETPVGRPPAAAAAAVEHVAPDAALAAAAQPSEEARALTIMWSETCGGFLAVSDQPNELGWLVCDADGAAPPHMRVFEAETSPRDGFTTFRLLMHPELGRLAMTPPGQPLAWVVRLSSSGGAPSRGPSELSPPPSEAQQFSLHADGGGAPDTARRVESRAAHACINVIATVRGRKVVRGHTTAGDAARPSDPSTALHLRAPTVDEIREAKSFAAAASFAQIEATTIESSSAERKTGKTRKRPNPSAAVESVGAGRWWWQSTPLPRHNDQGVAEMAAAYAQTRAPLVSLDDDQIEVFVTPSSPDAADAQSNSPPGCLRAKGWSASCMEPVDSLPAAQALVRAIRSRAPDTPVVVRLGAGTHTVTTPLRLTMDDSGASSSAPVVWDGADGRAEISGGFDIPSSCWRESTSSATARILECTLGDTPSLFRTLCINGRISLPSRFPARGALLVKSGKLIKHKGAGGTLCRKQMCRAVTITTLVERFRRPDHCRKHGPRMGGRAREEKFVARLDLRRSHPRHGDCSCHPTEWMERFRSSVPLHSKQRIC